MSYRIDRFGAVLKTVLGVGGLMMAGSQAAYAQGAVESTDTEIVVTATKHGEVAAQDVPIALTAFSSQQLEALNFQSLQSLSYTMPNVQLEDLGTSPGIANFTIRGIGINSSIPSVDPTVGVFVDGMYLALNGGIIVDNFDLEGIEVLRGPQGTLYGRNVTGGAVLLKTRTPSDEFYAAARVGVETGPEYYGDFTISGPLVPEVLQAKIAVYHSHDDGWFTNKFDNSDFGESDTAVYRGALRWAPSDSVDFTLRVEQGNANSDGPAAQNHGLFRRGTFDFSVNDRGYADLDWEQAILETNIHVGFGNGTITDIWGWRDYLSLTDADIDATGSTPAPLTSVGGTQFHSRSVTKQDQWSNELRYAGTFGPVDVTVGHYYFQQNLLYVEERLLFSGVFLGPNFTSPFNITRVGGGDGEFSTSAVFANADWHLNDQWTLNFGARYSHEEKDARISRIRRAADNLDGAAVVVPGEGVIGGSIANRTLNFSDTPFNLAWNDTSPRLGVQWQPNHDTNFYAFWAKGFRSGGVNFRVTTLNPPGASGRPTSFDAEEESSYEVGWKQEWADGRVRLNVAAFHNTIDGIQRETNVPEAGSGVQQVIVNAGDAVFQGAEFDARFKLTDAFAVTMQAGYTDASYDKVTADLDGNGVVNGADLDQQIPRVAPWTYGANLLYDLPIAGGMLSSRVGFNHRDASVYNDSNLGHLAKADILDANFQYSPENGHWSISVYGENLTDEATWGGDTILPSTPTFGFIGQGLATFSPLNEGRVIGVELRLRN